MKDQKGLRKFKSEKSRFDKKDGKFDKNRRPNRESNDFGGFHRESRQESVAIAQPVRENKPSGAKSFEGQKKDGESTVIKINGQPFKKFPLSKPSDNKKCKILLHEHNGATDVVFEGHRAIPKDGLARKWFIDVTANQSSLIDDIKVKGWWYI